MTSIPTNKLPIKFSVGTDVPDPSIYPKIDGTEADNQLKNGHILWLRGIARLHTQVIKLICKFECSIINCFFNKNSFKY